MDSSADKEVMDILSSPVAQKKFVVKPQPRPPVVGGPTTAGPGAMVPAPPQANGHNAASSSGNYLGEAVGGSGGGDGKIAGGLASGVGVVVEPSSTSCGLANVVHGISPPRHVQNAAVLSKPTGTSWDPHAQSSCSAFSVPAGRGSGVLGTGGRSDGAGGVSGGGGGGGLGALNLGGFRNVGGDPGDFKVKTVGVPCHRTG